MKKTLSRSVMIFSLLVAVAIGGETPPSRQNSQESLINSCDVLMILADKRAANNEVHAVAIISANFWEIEKEIYDKTKIKKYDDYFSALRDANAGQFPTLFAITKSSTGWRSISTPKPKGGGWIHRETDDFLKEFKVERTLPDVKGDDLKKILPSINPMLENNPSLDLDSSSIVAPKHFTPDEIKEFSKTFNELKAEKLKAN